MYVTTGRRSGRNFPRGQRDAEAKEKEKAIQMAVAEEKEKAIQMAVAQKEKKEILAKKEAKRIEGELKEAYTQGYRIAMCRAQYRQRVDTGVLRDYKAKDEYKRWQTPRRAVAIPAEASPQR